MMSFVKRPHLPEGKVRQLILGEKYKKALETALLEQNITPIWLNNNNFVDERLSGHCDLMAIHLGENKLAVSDGVAQDCDKIHNIKLLRVSSPQKPEYPHDAKLNICIVGDKIIYNPKSADDQIISLLSGMKLCCKQGYTKCSVCIVDENSIITSDTKIAAIASAAGMDVLTVNEKITALDGFEHGFVGGASFKISKNKLAFTGIINDIAEKKRIENFLNAHGVNAVYLTDKPLFDIGSAIPIIEEI